MGEATPAQSAAGAAAGTFVPMLGVGLGAMPGGVVGNGPMVATSRGGSADPQLHNAIVERLRARIEQFRRHHSTCENRYQRGQAESTDREHENTLHLLNIVQQGPGNRKSKGSRGSNQQPPDYSRANGEQKGSEGEQKISTRIALQGSLRRKMEGNTPGLKQNGLSCAFSGSDFKRVRLDASGLGQGSCNHNLTHPLQGSSTIGLQRKNYMMPHGIGSDMFHMTLKEMKKEPQEIQSCGHSNSEMIFDFKDEGSGQIDPELQELFDELTKSVPPLNDFEFEKILKQDDTFGLDLGRPNSAGAAATLCSPVDKVIKTEHSQDFGQGHNGSPQLRPASAGPSFTLNSTTSTNTSQKGNAQTGHSRTMPCWPEISHAQQLKQMAANQQQPGALLHHQHQTQHVGMTSWTTTMSPQPTTSSFAKAKVSNQATLNQQKMGSHNKGISNCLFKSNGHNGSHQLDMKGLSSKPTLHFSPKVSHSTSQSMSIMTNSMTKTEQHQQSPSPSQNQAHSALHFQNQQISTSSAVCLQPKSVSAGLPFRMPQQQQAVPAGPRMPTSGSLGGLPAPSQPQPSAPSNQQKGPARGPPIQRQVNLQQHSISNTDKDNTHDQFSRHLTRPPPDYKQSRSLVGIQQANIFPGQNPAQSPSNGPDNNLQSISCQLSSGPTSKMSPLPSDRRFGIRPDCHPSSCIGQFQQQNSHGRIGLSQSKPRFLAPSTQGKSFGMNNVAGVQHQRATADLHSSRVPVQNLGGSMTNVSLSWGSANKQVAAGLRRLPNPLQLQGVQDLPNHPYQQRHIGPPNQVAPDAGMPSLGDAGQARPSQAMMGCPSPLGNLSHASPEQRVPAASFPDASPSSSSYQNNRSNRLTFDFLPEGDNTVPGINADSDFIDSLLKSGSGNDDWMKDINLDEILGSHS
ncbi:mastermind-like protein 2 [Xiphophorus maculatus]|uniref:Neurogenic mastermind-like N-terminal domain-containing protein n=1 Tax=Xiphophorus maculatus TaxID=8083 RepID=M3ZZB1_XIPMA|nr:mastermind-like protein 2 [Xiphophorus maculatus]